MWRTRPNLRRADLETITAPTLVIVGEADVVSASHARLMAEWLANGSLAIVAGGHYTPVTQARRVNELIAEFLKPVPSEMMHIHPAKSVLDRSGDTTRRAEYAF